LELFRQLFAAKRIFFAIRFLGQSRSIVKTRSGIGKRISKEKRFRRSIQRISMGSAIFYLQTQSILRTNGLSFASLLFKIKWNFSFIGKMK